MMLYDIDLYGFLKDYFECSIKEQLNTLIIMADFLVDRNDIRGELLQLRLANDKSNSIGKTTAIQAEIIEYITNHRSELLKVSSHWLNILRFGYIELQYETSKRVLVFNKYHSWTNFSDHTIPLYNRSNIVGISKCTEFHIYIQPYVIEIPKMLLENVESII